MGTIHYLCPLCQVLLEPQREVELGRFWLCPKCGGMLCNLSVLRKLTDDKTMRTLWSQALQAQPGRRGCPVCRQPMRQVGGPSSGGEQTPPLPTTDICRSCQFIWLDTLELQALPSNPELNEPAEPAKPLPPHLQERLALANLEMVKQRQVAQGDDEGGHWWLTLFLKVVLRLFLRF